MKRGVDIAVFPWLTSWAHGSAPRFVRSPAPHTTLLQPAGLTGSMLSPIGPKNRPSALQGGPACPEIIIVKVARPPVRPAPEPC